MENEPIFQRKLRRIVSGPKDREFSVVAYNILCDEVFATNSAKYSHVSNDVKFRGPEPNSSVRHTQLLKELRWLNADVVCLQEVDPFYFPHLVRELGRLGYQGLFQRHREDPEHDGLATFFKTEKFTLVESNAYGFNQLLDTLCDLDQFKNCNKHNQRFAQYTLLQEANTRKQVLIVNVHLIFGFWQQPDLNAMQAALFFQQIQRVLPAHTKDSTPWVVCGDFNMCPHFPVYELVSSGKLSDDSCEKLNPAKCVYPQLMERKEIKNYDSVVLRHLRNNLSHPFSNSKSAYQSVLGAEPVFTHYECDDVFPEVFGFDTMKDTLDYIWYSSDKLQVNAVLEMVKEELIKPFKACPNKFFPSDHLSLKACFQFA